MTLKEKEAEIRHWRNLWSWIEEDTKYYLTKVGSVCRIVTRNYTGYLGTFLQPHFTLKEFEIEVVKREYNYDDGEYYNENKVLRVPISQVTHIEFVSQRELQPKEDLTKQLEEANVMSSNSVESEIQ